MRNRSRQATITGFVALVLSGHASAQTDFSGVKLRIGDTALVTRVDGEHRGVVRGISPTSITFDSTTIKPEAGLRIDRLGDSLLNGALWGLGIGVVSAAVTFPGAFARRAVGGDRCTESLAAACFAAIGAIGAGIGALIDYLHPGRTEVYRWAAPPPPLELSLGLNERRTWIAATWRFHSAPQ